MIGVQSEKNRKHDFTHYRRPWPFVIVGLIALGIFLAVLIFVAQLVVA